MESSLSVSIIIPIYNIENIVGRTLDSLTSQIKDTDDVEVICVNDCSTDNTLKVVNKYKNIKVISLDSKVPTGVVRNIGMKEASKKFIQFLDGDDLININTLRNMQRFMEIEDLDIAIAEYTSFDILNCKIMDEHMGIHFNMTNNKLVVKTKEVIDKLYQLTNNAAWNKLFKKKFLDENNLKFSECTYAEDMAFTNSCLTCSNKVGFLRKNLIMYTHPSTNIKSNDRNSNNNWNELFVSLDVIYNRIISKKDTLDCEEYSLLLKSFLVSCLGNIEYQNKKLVRANLVENSFNKKSMEYLNKIVQEIEECTANIIL